MKGRKQGEKSWSENFGIENFSISDEMSLLNFGTLLFGYEKVCVDLPQVSQFGLWLGKGVETM